MASREPSELDGRWEYPWCARWRWILAAVTAGTIDSRSSLASRLDSVPVFDLEDDNLADANGVILVVQKQNISSLERRFHRATQNHHHGTLALGHKHQALRRSKKVVN